MLDENQLEENRAVRSQISRLNMILTGSGLFFLMIGSYLSLDAAEALKYPGQYFFMAGIALSCLGMVSIFLRPDF